MSQYSLKSFLTLIPQDLLEQYFGQEKLFPGHDWKKELDVDKFSEKILGDDDAKKVDFHFRTIHRWANDSGIDDLIEEARSPMHDGGLEIGEELKELANDHACSMYIWLNYREVFDWAIDLTVWEHRKGKTHHYVGAGLDCEGTDDEIRESLGNAIAEHYEKQRKGRRCEVEYYKRLDPTRHIFFANPEDSAKGYRRYDKKNKIVRDSYVPIFQVVFEYNEEDGDLAIHVNGKVAQKKMYDEFCTKVLKYKEPPNAETEVFDLKILRDGKYLFPEDKDLPVESVTLKMAMIELKTGSNKRITLEASPFEGDNRQVEAMMLQSYTAHGVKPEDVLVRKAKIEIVYKPVNMQKIRPITFTVGAPQFSDLSTDEKSERAKKYLRICEILVKHKPKEEPANVVQMPKT